MFFWITTRQPEVCTSLSQVLFPLFDDLQKVDHETLYREPVISLRRCSWFFPWAPFISSLYCLWRCIAEGNASRRAAFANCNLRTSRRTYHVQRQSVMKVSIKCRWRDFSVAREKRVVAKILFYAVTAAFSGFWRDERIIARRRGQKPVIYKGHKGGISRRNWKRGLFLTEGHFHPRDMSLKTISNFVACGKCSVRYVCTKHRAYRKKKDIRAVYAATIAMNQFREICAVALSITIAHACVIFFRRARNQAVIW